MYAGYDDEWILANYKKYVYRKDLFNAYYKQFGFGNIKNFRSHLASDLKLTRRYTEEQDNFIRDVYPRCGAKETHRLFCEKYGKKGLEGFKSHINELGIHVSAERQAEADADNGQRDNVPLGTITKRKRGANYIKVNKGTDGWIPLSHHILGKPRRGESVVHLDGDKSNDSPNNLVMVSRKVSARMTANRFWSENATITKTAIKCCELEQVLAEQHQNTKSRREISNG